MKNPLDAAELQTAIDQVHRAGMPGVFAEVRDGDQVWRGAAGVADVSTGRPVTPDMRHRVGSISKTFTAPRLCSRSRPVRSGSTRPSATTCRGWYPEKAATRSNVRMLINHTSGLAEYLPYAYPCLKAFPSLKDTTQKSLDDHRFTRFHPTELIEMGVNAPAAGTPGDTPGIYSKTNYQLLCQLLERVTGTAAEKCITRMSLSGLGSGTPSFQPERMSAGRIRRCTRRGSG